MLPTQNMLAAAINSNAPYAASQSTPANPPMNMLAATGVPNPSRFTQQQQQVHAQQAQRAGLAIVRQPPSTTMFPPVRRVASTPLGVTGGIPLGVSPAQAQLRQQHQQQIQHFQQQQQQQQQQQPNPRMPTAPLARASSAAQSTGQVMSSLTQPSSQPFAPASGQPPSSAAPSASTSVSPRPRTTPENAASFLAYSASQFPAQRHPPYPPPPYSTSPMQIMSESPPNPFSSHPYDPSSSSADIYPPSAGPSFTMPPPSNMPPPRTPSISILHSIHQSSPPPTQDQLQQLMAMQQQQRPPSRPPRTPSSIIGTLSAARNQQLPQPVSQTPQIPFSPPHFNSHHPIPIAPRPPAPTLAVGGIPNPAARPTSSSGRPPHLISSNPSLQQPPQPSTSSIPPQPIQQAQSLQLQQQHAQAIQQALPPGQGLVRLLQFSGALSNENKNSNKPLPKKLQLSWWNDLVTDYFTPKAIMRLTLWKDNQRAEAKPFEIGVPILPRFFLVTTQSGVKSMTLSLDGARERSYSLGHTVVECVSAVWSYKYANGYTVTLKGPLTAHVVVCATSPPPTGACPITSFDSSSSSSSSSSSNPLSPTGASSSSSSSSGPSSLPAYTLKFEDLQFDANIHDKFIALDAILGIRSLEENARPAHGLSFRERELELRERERERDMERKIRMSSPNVMSPNSSAIELQEQLEMEEEQRWAEPRVRIDQTIIPGEPVNAFGIPQATMRCLELAESVIKMEDLIAFARQEGRGPKESLMDYAKKIRDNNGFLTNGPHVPLNGVHLLPNNTNTTSNGTLYSAAPPSITNPTQSSQAQQHQHLPGSLQQNGMTPIPGSSSTMSSPQNTAGTLSTQNSPAKQLKSIPQQQQGQGQTPLSQSSSIPSGPPGSSAVGPASSSPSVSASSGIATNTHTPAMSNTSLKRKQTSDASSSPSTGAPGSEQQQQQQHAPPPKRVPRKRGRTGTNGGG